MPADRRLAALPAASPRAAARAFARWRRQLAMRATLARLRCRFALLALAALAGCAQLGLARDPFPPVIFVHGRGDSAASWQTMIWRFESNGWPRQRLFAIDVPYPTANGDGAAAQPGRASAADPMQVVSDEVDRILARTRTDRAVVVGSSSDGYVVRSAVKNGAAAKAALHAALVESVRGHYVPRSPFNDSRTFERTWQFAAGATPRRLAIVAESSPVLGGRIEQPATRRPLAGARVEVYEVVPGTGERLGAPLYAGTTGADGRWGPMPARSDAPYEFVLAAPGFAVTHVYRSAFPRSSDIVDLQPVRLTGAERAAGSVVIMSRPRGDFDLRRDHLSLDGAALPGVTPGAIGVSESMLLLPPGPVRTVIAECNGERIAVRNWPAAQNQAVIAELHY